MTFTATLPFRPLPRHISATHFSARTLYTTSKACHQSVASRVEASSNVLLNNKGSPNKFELPLKPFRSLIIGAPGAGKGTLTKLLSNEMSINNLSAGDIIRNQISEGTDLGKQAKGFVSSGKLVPDTLVVDLVLDSLARMDSLTSRWCLDG